MKQTAILVSAAIVALGGASAALAQTTPAAAPAQITVNVPGVCVLSREGIVGQSKVGKYVQTRLQQLSQQVNAELSGEGSSLQNDAKSFDAKKSTLQAAQQQQQQQALQTRYQALQQKSAQRDRELQTTEQKAVQRVLQEATPLVADVVRQHACGVVLDANSVLAANAAMDLTPSVVAALDGKIIQFDFEREHLDGQALGPQR